MERIVYIGDYAGKTVYFDTKKKVILKSKSTPLVNSEKTKNSTRNTVCLIIGLTVLQPFLRMF